MDHHQNIHLLYFYLDPNISVEISFRNLIEEKSICRELTNYYSHLIGHVIYMSNISERGGIDMCF